MTISTRFALSGFILASLLACQSIYAFNKPGNVSLTFGGGYDYFSSARYVKNSGIGFGELGYNLTERWGIEGLFGLFHTESRRSATYGKDVSGDMFAINAVYHFAPWKALQPYLLAGPGVMGFDPNGSDPHQQGNFNGAAGVQIFFDEVVALRLEARDFYTITGGKNDVFLNAGVTFLINT